MAVCAPCVFAEPCRPAVDPDFCDLRMSRADRRRDDPQSAYAGRERIRLFCELPDSVQSQLNDTTGGILSMLYYDPFCTESLDNSNM